VNRFAAALLATTSLSGIAVPAVADIVYENTSPFGTSDTAPTLTALGDTLFVGNLDQTTPSWFEVPAQSFDQNVQIQFTAARLEGGAIPLDHLGEGSSLLTFLGTPIVSVEGSAGPAIMAVGGTFEGSSYPAIYQPVLNLFTIAPAPSPSEGASEGSSLPVLFADVVPPGFVGFANSPEGASVSDSYILDLVLPAGEALPLSFTYDFDYTLDVQTSQTQTGTIPEPATATLLGLGLAGLVAARRRRTRII
jgi:hypothetical protein